MMKISAIKQQVKRQDRYSIYGDGKYLFSLSGSELIRLALKVGQELDEQELHQLKDKAQADKAYDRALNLISHRPRSEWELSFYLKRKEYPEKIIQQTLVRLRERRYVDDMSFARAWIANRRLLKSTTKRRLTQELRQKHLSNEIISQALSEDQTDERQVLRELIERKRRQTKYQDNLKLMQYLSRQGFSYEDIKSAFK